VPRNKEGGQEGTLCHVKESRGKKIGKKKKEVKRGGGGGMGGTAGGQDKLQGTGITRKIVLNRRGKEGEYTP